MKKRYFEKDFYIIPKAILKTKKKHKESQISMARKILTKFPEKTQEKLKQNNLYLDLFCCNKLEIIDENKKKIRDYKLISPIAKFKIQSYFEEYLYDDLLTIEDLILNINNLQGLFRHHFKFKHETGNSIIGITKILSKNELEKEIPEITENDIEKLAKRLFVNQLIFMNSNRKLLFDNEHCDELINLLQDLVNTLNVKINEIRNTPVNNQNKLSNLSTEINDFINKVILKQLEKIKDTNQILSTYITFYKSGITPVILFSYKHHIIDKNVLRMSSSLFDMGNILNTLLYNKNTIEEFLIFLKLKNNLDIEEERKIIENPTESYMNKQLLVLANILQTEIPLSFLTSLYTFDVPEFNPKLLDVINLMSELSLKTRDCFSLIKKYSLELLGPTEQK